MTKTSARRFIAAYFIVFFGAVLLRIDYFPMSWVPMYGFREEAPQLTVAVGDLNRRAQGFDAVRANGETLSLSERELNVPPANFRRLYQERAFGIGPPQHRRERQALWPINRWWYDRLIGPDPALSADYPRDLLRSVNATLGFASNDPRRIVELRSHLDFATFTRAQLDSGDLSRPVVERRVAVITDGGVAVHATPVILPHHANGAQPGV